MEKFKYGIMVIDPKNLSEDDAYEVVHFAGYWQEPTDVDADNLREELRNDPEFELQDSVDRLIMYPATEDCLKFYNDICEADGVFDEITSKKKELNGKSNG